MLAHGTLLPKIQTMELLIITATQGDSAHLLHDRHVSSIQSRFPTLEVEVARDAATAEQVASADILAGFPGRIPKLQAGMNVQWIHSFSAGVDHLLTPDMGIDDSVIITNSSGIHAIPIAEHVLGLILASNKKFPILFKNQTNKVWHRQSPATELHGKTVLIVGLGAIGTKIATLLKAFECTVHGVVRTLRDKPACVDELHTTSTMGEALSKADYVIICLPGNTETNHLFDANLFKQMKPAAIIVNIGRGTSVNQSDLIDALQNNQIGGALLDVTTPEPLPAESPLWDMPNVIITPHCSASNPHTMDRAVERLCINMEAFLQGTPLPNEVDKKLGY